MGALASGSWHRTGVTGLEQAEGVPPSVAGRPPLLVRWWRWFLGSSGGPISPWRTIVWWEARRLPYNALLAVFGSVALVIFLWAITQCGEEDAFEPLGLLAGVVLANVAYTLGWMTELLVNAARRPGPRRVGPLLLRVGLLVSAVVVFAPAIIWVSHLIVIRR